MEHQKLQGLMTDAERIARVASAGLLAAQAKQTAPSGAISLDNADGTRTIIGEVVNGESNPSYTMATHVGDTTPPGVPTGITATSKSGVVVVEWDGTLDGGIPDDFFCVRVYLDNVELGALTEAGSVASAKLDGGTTVSITATSEDDCCLPDGTPDHNVSQASQAISVTVSSSAEEIIVDVEEEIEGVQQEITDFKREVAADYYKSEYIDDNFSTVEEVGAVYRDSMAKNLSPFYAHDLADVYNATTNPDGYWTETPLRATQLEDGWAHIVLPNESGTGTMYSRTYVRPMASVPESATLLIEIRNLVTNVTSLTDPPRLWFNASASNSQMWCDVVYFNEGGTYRLALVKTNNASPTHFARWWWAIAAGGDAEFDARISVYDESGYDGPFKAYVTSQDALTREYATKTWTKQTAEDYSIGAAQRYTATIANPNLTPLTAHDLTDRYNATTNPGGYWRADLSWAENISDGWTHVELEPATGTRWGQQFQTVLLPDLKPSTKYTLLMEYRNVQVTGTLTAWPLYASTDQFVYPPETTSFTVDQDMVVRAQLVTKDSFEGVTGGVDARHRLVAPSGGDGSCSYDIRLSLYECATDAAGKTIPYDGPYKPYVTDQQALSKEYATQSQLTVGINGIRTEVSRDYQTKAAMGDYSTTAQMNTAIDQSAQSITSTVAATYETQSHAGTTYSTKSEVQQTVSGLDTRISANATAISGEVTARETLIRQYANGVLVCKVGESVGALVNASGSFDVVSVTWSGNEPTVTGTLSTFMQNLIELGKGNTSAEIQFCDNTGNISVKPNYRNEQALTIDSPATTVWGDNRVVVSGGADNWLRRFEINQNEAVLYAATESGGHALVSASSSTGALSLNGSGTSGSTSVIDISSNISAYPNNGMRISKAFDPDGTLMRGIYFGSKVLNPNNSATMTLFTAAECQSMFGRALDQTKDVIIVQNGDSAAYSGQITGGINASGDLTANINPTKAGAIRYQYIVILGA